jgi:transmembrane protein TMEM260 (protein O-mannosyltransferase)
MSARHGDDKAGHEGREMSLAGLVVFAGALALYGATALRGLDHADNGELAAVAWTLGIAHPTGYPTLTLLGHAMAHALPWRPILTLNLLSALFGAASAAALASVFHEALAIAGRDLAPRARTIAAAAAALAIAGSGIWWDQAQRWEVYSLHALLLALATGFFLRFAERGERGPAFAVTLGLAFTAHMTTILLAPAFLVLWLARRGFGARSLRSLLLLAPWFALGLTPYLYLPVRSAQGPRFDWDAPHTGAGFLRMLGARDYGGWLFTDPGTFAGQWSYFFGRLPGEVGFLGVPLALIGLLSLARGAPRLAVFALLLFGASVLFAGGYGIPDIGSYFLVAMLGLGIAIAAGLARLPGRLGAGAVAAAGMALVGLVLVAQLPAHAPPAVSAVELMAHDLLEPLPPNAVVLTNEWDAWASGSLYLQEVEGLRRDVTVIDGELLERPWYLDELARRAPEVGAMIHAEIEGMREEARVGRAGEPAFDAAYRELWRVLVEEARRRGPVFVTRDEIARLAPEVRTTPFGLAFEVVRDTAAGPPPPLPRWRFRAADATRDPYGAETCELYARAALDRAYVEARQGLGERAAADLALARSYDPGWRAKDLPPQPWGASETMGKSLAFFDQLGNLGVPDLLAK